MRKRLLWWLCLLSSVGVASYALVVYTQYPLGQKVHPQMMANYQANRLLVYLHIFGAMIALAIGPFQFLQSFRIAKPQLHRFLGKIYLLFGVGIGGIAALFMSTFAYGGLPSTLGFGILAILWLYTGLQAYRHARRRDFAQHRAWMVRNFSLTFAAVTLRILLGLGFAFRFPFDIFYPMLSWLCWVPNLLLAQVYLRRTQFFYRINFE